MLNLRTACDKKFQQERWGLFIHLGGTTLVETNCQLSMFSNRFHGCRCYFKSRANMVLNALYYFESTNNHKPGTAKILLIEPEGCSSIGKHVF